MTTRGVSVIICCYNSASRLGVTLEHLAQQQTSGRWPWEIVVVNNASTDNTVSIAEFMWRRFGRVDVPLVIADQSRPGLSWARAKGVETAHYDTFIFCDDDNWLAPNYVEDAFDILDMHSDVGALGGTGSAVTDVPLPAWFERYKNCFACYPQGDQEGELFGTYAFLYGAGLVVRREALDKLTDRKFEAVLPDRVGTKLTSGGDTELSYALRLIGYKLWFSEKLVFQHYLPASRLTEKYLGRLVSSLSYCSGLLIVYNYLLEGKRITPFTWLKDCVYQLAFFLRALAMYPIKRQTSLEKKLGLLFSFHKFMGIVVQVGAYGRRDRQIRRLIK